VPTVVQKLPVHGRAGAAVRRRGSGWLHGSVPPGTLWRRVGGCIEGGVDPAA
jgi:hypothetical protein